MKSTDNTLENQVIAMSNTLAQKATRFTALQQRLFYVTLASLKQGTNSKNEVRIDKQELFEYLGMNMNDTYRWSKLRYQFKRLRENSGIEFGTDEEFNDGFLITKVRSTKHDVYVKFEEDFLPLVQELADNFVRLLDDDVVSFGSKFSMMLYQNLMKDKWKLTSPEYFGCDYSTKRLKMMFGLEKDDYVRKDGTFDRKSFEMKTTDKAVKEINEKSRCIRNLKYRKIKKGNRIRCYLFTFDFIDPQDAVFHQRNKKALENIEDRLASGENEPRQLAFEEFDDEIKDYDWWRILKD